MLSLAACSSASISFSKVDKTLRFEARLINKLKICEGSFSAAAEGVRSVGLDFLLLPALTFGLRKQCFLFIKKKVKRKKE
jgi:hypothetical protein